MVVRTSPRETMHPGLSRLLFEIGARERNRRPRGNVFPW
jgi:hypothetical protein